MEPGGYIRRSQNRRLKAIGSLLLAHKAERFFFIRVKLCVENRGLEREDNLFSSLGALRRFIGRQSRNPKVSEVVS